MLTPLDDTLWHQLPTSFDHVGTSDPRFFDRYWFAMYDPRGRVAMQFTLACYSNMNVMDGGFAVVHGGQQHSVRASRSLRPVYEPSVGPLAVEVVEPMAHHRLSVADGAHGLAAALDWRSVAPPEEEKPHFRRVRGRVHEDYQRFNQIGAADGWVRIGGERIDVRHWWACRDHSWGVRPGVGHADPMTGPPPATTGGTLFCFLFFSTRSLAGHVQVAEFAGAPRYVTALVRRRDVVGDPGRAVASADLSFTTHPGTRRFDRAELQLVLAGGEPLTLECTPLGPAVSMPQLGYSGGFTDGLGLGVWRGDEHVEWDAVDVSHVADVVLPGGAVTRPAHRIAPVHVRAAGADDEGTGSMTLLATGPLPSHGLA